jgi:hypothetical protein
MLKLITPLVFLSALFIVSTSSAAAQSYDAAIVTERNNCLIPDGNRQIRVFKCTDGGARYYIDNGRVRTSDGLCFDHGVPRGTRATNQNAGVSLVPCHGGSSQVWYFMRDGVNVNMAQNAANTDVCLNIEGGNDSPGSRVLVWPCNFGRSQANERFYLGGKLSPAQVAQLPSQVRNLTSGSYIFPSGARLVAAGAGNLVAAGGGNLVGLDGASIIAASAAKITVSLPPQMLSLNGAQFIR